MDYGMDILWYYNVTDGVQEAIYMISDSVVSHSKNNIHFDTMHSVTVVLEHSVRKLTQH